MLTFAQILWGKVHWIFEADEFPDYPPDADGNELVFVDITDTPEVQEGWFYDSETGEFTAPPEPEPIPEPETIQEEPSIQEQLLFNSQYHTILLEMGVMM